MLSTISSSTSRSPSSFSVQRAWPSGGSEPASATSFASAAPSSLRGLRLACLRRSSAASIPSSTQRLRTRSAVARPSPRTDAIAESVSPPPARASSASRRMCACRRRCADALPRTIAESSSRSSSESTTRYRFLPFRSMLGLRLLCRRVVQQVAPQSNLPQPACCWLSQSSYYILVAAQNRTDETPRPAVPSNQRRRSTWRVRHPGTAGRMVCLQRIIPRPDGGTSWRSSCRFASTKPIGRGKTHSM